MNFVEDVLERYPSSRPALLAIDSSGERVIWHFGELIARSAGISGAMAARGVQRGEVVGCVAGSRIELVLTMLACWRMGAIAAPVSPTRGAAHIAAAAELAPPRMWLADERGIDLLPAAATEVMDMDGFWDALDEDRPQEWPVEPATLSPADPAQILFVPGPGGRLRAIVHAQRHLAAQRLSADAWLGAGDRDLVWSAATADSGTFLRDAFVAPWLTGAAGLLHDAPLDPRERLGIARREGVVVLEQEPADLAAIAHSGALDDEGLPEVRRLLIAAGGFVSAEVSRRWQRATGLVPRAGIAPPETGPLFAAAGPEDDEAEPAPGVLGDTTPGIRIRLAEGEGDQAEAWIHAPGCPGFCTGYLTDGDVRSPTLVDGDWWPSGELTERDADGSIRALGPASSAIGLAGRRVSDQMIAATVCDHPGVADAAALPWEEPGGVASIRILVVPAVDDPDARANLISELRSWLPGRLPAGTVPRVIEAVKRIERDSFGRPLTPD